MNKWAWLMFFPAYISHFHTELLAWVPEALLLQWAMSRVLAPGGLCPSSHQAGTAARPCVELSY